ncbi:MAG: heat-inducible transcriptional repressor HrcA [Candidatus Margulisbacteria bacterium]|nr:heat-inducible transcriptional repressor HrcA [Candidatus Margulisiibacteriota bacterium]
MNRKDIIMQALIKDYIDNGEPLSSALLVDKTNLDLSSATMRNELANLEKEGFVKHLHTSSGRIPTDKGYRYYVDHLMNRDNQLKVQEAEYLQNMLEDVSTSIDKVLAYTAQILSQMTKYPIILIAENQHKNILKFIQLVLLNVHQILLVVLNNYGENFQEIIHFEKLAITQEELNKVSEVLNNVCSDIPLDNLGPVFMENMERVKVRFTAYEDILVKIFSAIRKSSALLSSKHVFIENSHNLLAYPEFQEIETLRKINTVLEDKNKVISLFQDQLVEKINSCIGSEHKVDELSPTSLVYGNLTVENENIAKVGVLGPVRMNYDNIFGVVDHTVKVLKRKFLQLFR